MDDYGTKEISNEGFVPISSDKRNPDVTVPFSDSQGGDQHGIRYVPTIIDFLEKRFTFSAALISIIGYVIIAAFGEIRSLGQYVGYAFFLGAVFLIYRGTELEKLKICITILIVFLIGLVVFLTWDHLAIGYHYVNQLFSLKMD